MAQSIWVRGGCLDGRDRGGGGVGGDRSPVRSKQDKREGGVRGGYHLYNKPTMPISIANLSQKQNVTKVNLHKETWTSLCEELISCNWSMMCSKHAAFEKLMKQY